ncbi:Dyp-type peroxidase [Flavitalea sp.]|nr:Dyp-type peroxidase [Flavitalea sp.]
MTLELEDIQGFIVRSYNNLEKACYVMIQFTNISEAKLFFKQLTIEITVASSKPTELAVQLAFTNLGIKKLTEDLDIKEPFSSEFSEGLCDENRSRILGDIDTNDPSDWNWGGPTKKLVDAVIMLFASTDNVLETKYQALLQRMAATGVTKVIRLDTGNTGTKEHFGFEDGLTNPLIKGMKSERKNIASTSDQHDVIMPGEFILGYENEYNKLPDSPRLLMKDSSEIDIGKNGTYMVFRELQQDVHGFWNYMNELKQTNVYFSNMSLELMASKMVGRWRNGKPLTKTLDPDAAIDPKANFLYAQDDKDGFKCPIGAHIRRSNPRDSIDDDPALSLEMTKKHMILRRARSFGEYLFVNAESIDLPKVNNDSRRGLYFICLNAQINRQFEFIQNTWCNNKKFDGLENDVDPLVGFPFLESKYQLRTFTVQDKPYRKKTSSLPQFVKVKGGAYFFMPGIRALIALCQE